MKIRSFLCLRSLAVLPLGAFLDRRQMNGNVITVLRNEAQADKHTTGAQIGH